MSKNYYTLEEIISYNICPNKHYMENILGYDRMDFKRLGLSPIKLRNKILYTISHNSLKKAIYSYFEGLQENHTPKNIYNLQDIYSNNFYKDCEVKDILETDASTSKGTPVFSEGLETLRYFYETYEKDKIATILLNKTYEIEIEGRKIRGHIDAILERNVAKSVKAHNTLDLFVIDPITKSIREENDLFYCNNPEICFGSYLMRNNLSFKESRIIVQPLYIKERRIIPALEDKNINNFKKLITNTCDNIDNKRYHVFPDRRKCISCGFAPVCRELL